MSGEVPAACDTIRRTGRAGQAWAKALTAAVNATVAQRARRIAFM